VDRMTPLDAAFLQAEDAEEGVSLAISSVAVFDGPVPTQAEFTAMLAARLPLVPRYRQKVRTIPLDLGPPVWVDDPAFDLSHHLQRTALPGPGGDTELAALVGRVMSARLDRSQPLWEYWLVEGLAGDRWALVSKVHHCMVDGVSATDLYRTVLDDTPEPRPAPPDTWRPTPEPPTAALTASALLALALNPMAQVRAVAAALRHPGRLAVAARDTLRGAAALATALVPARATSLSGPLSAHRVFAFSRGTVADVRAVRHAAGGTFNDVVLAAVSGGFRALLLSRGEEPDARAVRSLVPVSVRAPGQESIRDNRVSLMLADLPVHIADPLERLAAVRAQLDELKNDREAEAGAALTSVAALEPFPLVAAPFRWAATLPQRSIVTVTTDVPGPRTPLYALGRPLVEIIPYVPIASTLRVGVSILTYLDRITVGVTGDRDAAPDIDILARGIADGLTELVAACSGRAANGAEPPGRSQHVQR
jgi:WS/DGAT/MGAT family acyltransferase